MDLILHHYAMSPFGRKIRSMLGYAGLDWQSAITREMPPRPVLAQLAGGYRKIPVAQIGADIFCDSRTIAAEIAALANKPELALENLDAEARAWAGRADLDLFFPCVLAAGTPAMRRKARESMSLLDMGRFVLDRIGMSRKAAVKIAGFREARPLVLDHLAQVEAQLQGDFLFPPTRIFPRTTGSGLSATWASRRWSMIFPGPWPGWIASPLLARGRAARLPRSRRWMLLRAPSRGRLHRRLGRTRWLASW